MMPMNDERFSSDDEEKENDTNAHVVPALGTDNRAPTYGGSWILGTDKGVYLRATNSCLLGNGETDDDSESVEEFPFRIRNIGTKTRILSLQLSLVGEKQ